MKAIRDLLDLDKGKGFLARATKGSQQIGQGRRSPRKQEVKWSKFDLPRREGVYQL